MSLVLLDIRFDYLRLVWCVVVWDVIIFRTERRERTALYNGEQ